MASSSAEGDDPAPPSSVPGGSSPLDPKPGPPFVTFSSLLEDGASISFPSGTTFSMKLDDLRVQDVPDDMKKLAKKISNILKTHESKDAIEGFEKFASQSTTRDWKKIVLLMLRSTSQTSDGDINMEKLYDNIIQQWFTADYSTSAKATNFTASYSARLAHVFACEKMTDQRNMLLQGGTRDQLDNREASKAKIYQAFADHMNDPNVKFDHILPGDKALSELDPNIIPPKGAVDGRKVQAIFNSMKRGMSQVLLKHGASGNGGEKPFWGFCDGQALIYYWHLVWQCLAFYRALSRTIPGASESGLARQRGVKRPSGEISLVQSPEEKGYYISKTNLAAFRTLEAKRLSVQNELARTTEGTETHGKLSKILDDLNEKWLASLE
jgi:hypothetical protein